MEEETPSEIVECMLCQENHNNQRTHPFGHVSLVQSSGLNILSKLSISERKLRNQTKNRISKFSTNITSCGHFLHFGCYDKFLSSLQAKLFSRERFAGSHLDIGKGYFECPLCKQVTNKNQRKAFIKKLRN